MGSKLFIIGATFLAEFALKIALSAAVGFVDGGLLQLGAKIEAVPHFPAAVPDAVPVHVRLAANVSELTQATVPIATRASASVRAKENLDLIQNPFFG